MLFSIPLYNNTGGSAWPGELTRLENTLFFRASEPDHGAELWSYDIGTASIQLVKDINPGANNSSFPAELISFKDRLYFQADDGEHGNELWVSDGTADGTHMLKNIADIWPRSNESSDPGGFAEAGDYLVFNAWYNKRTLFRLKIHNTSTVGTTEQQSGTSLFKLYPNPAHSTIVIEPGTKSAIQYRMLDISGREIMNGSILNGSKTYLDLSSLGSGLYIIRGDSENASQTRLFTKE